MRSILSIVTLLLTLPACGPDQDIGTIPKNPRSLSFNHLNLKIGPGGILPGPKWRWKNYKQFKNKSFSTYKSKITSLVKKRKIETERIGKLLHFEHKNTEADIFLYVLDLAKNQTEVEISILMEKLASAITSAKTTSYISNGIVFMEKPFFFRLARSRSGIHNGFKTLTALLELKDPSLAKIYPNQIQSYVALHLIRYDIPAVIAKFYMSRKKRGVKQSAEVEDNFSQNDPDEAYEYKEVKDSLPVVLIAMMVERPRFFPKTSLDFQHFVSKIQVQNTLVKKPFVITIR